MANPAILRRQLARTCKKYGLLIQPKALPLLLAEMAVRTSPHFAELLTLFQQRLARAARQSSSSSSSSATNLVTFELVERILQEQDEEQQQQQQQQVVPKKRNSRTQKRAVINNDDDDDEDDGKEVDVKVEGGGNKYNALVVASSRSKLKSEAKSNKRNTSQQQQFWKIISAFETPKLVYDAMRKQFRYEQSSRAPSLLGSSQELMRMRIQRYELVKQKVDRYRQEQRLSYFLTTIDRLLGTTKKKGGSDGECTLVGMLKSNPSLHCLELEDPTGCVPLRIDLLSSSSTDNDDDDDDDHKNNKNNYIVGCDVNTTGIYLEGSMVVVTGYHEESSALFQNEEETGGGGGDGGGTYFRCTSIDLPPLELKSTTLLHLPPSPYSYEEGFQQQQQRVNKQRDLVSIYSLSNLSLDDPDCVERLEHIMDRMVAGKKKKKKKAMNRTVDYDQDQEESESGSILVLFGNFCTESMTSSQGLEELAEVLQRKQLPSHHSILIVPGPNDVGSNACWPLPAWHKKNTPSLLHPFLAASSSSSSSIKLTSKRMRDSASSTGGGVVGNVYLCSNPCRLECADGRQVVLVRKDLIRESLQHQVLTDADSRAYTKARHQAALWSSSSSSSSSASSVPPSLVSRVIQHTLRQGHLSPSSSSQQAASTACAPIYWNYDHAMTVYPLPEVLLVGLDPEYLDTGFDNQVEDLSSTTTTNGGQTEIGMGGSGAGAGSGCRVISPASKPSQNEWECSVITLGTDQGGKNHVNVEFWKNDEDEDDDDEEEEDYVEKKRVEEDNQDNDEEQQQQQQQQHKNEEDEELYENYRMLGGTQTSQSQQQQLSMTTF